jgi:hypothetical protein
LQIDVLVEAGIHDDHKVERRRSAAGLRVILIVLQ